MARVVSTCQDSKQSSGWLGTYIHPNKSLVIIKQQQNYEARVGKVLLYASSQLE